MALKLKKSSDIPKVKRKSRRLGFSAARGARFAIMIGDEGAVLIHVKDKTVISRQFIPDASVENLATFEDTLKLEIAAPVYLIIDTMDQAFVQQTLPPVSSMSVGKLIKRRLDRDFGVNDIKGALLIGREKSGRKDWNFLMVSIERTQAIGVWLDFCAQLPNMFGGILLLSVETERIITHFENTLDLPEAEEKSEWKFLVSHNKVGGFRQVILRNGRIIFTRMTQPIGESTPEVIAGNIEQETSGTIEYMKRLGFVPQAGLDVYVITSGAVRDVLDLARLNARLTHVMTPFEAAQALGMSGATQQGDQFGDIVTAGCVVMDKKHVLLLTTPQFTAANTLYQFIQYQRVLAVLALLGTLGYAGMQGYDYYTSHANEETLSEQKSNKKNALGVLKTSVSNTNLDINRISDTIDLYKIIKDQNTSPVPLIMRLDGVSRLPINIKSIDWSLGDGTDKSKPAALPSGAPDNMRLKMVAILTIEFKDANKGDVLLKAQSEKVLEFFRTAFPEYSVEYAKPVVAPVKESDSVDINFDPKQDAKKSTDASATNKVVEAQLIIKGAAIAAAAPLPNASAGSAPAVMVPVASPLPNPVTSAD